LARPLLSQRHAMARLLRFIPAGGSLVEVTTRTFQSRLLLTPKPLLNRIIIGALARASHRYEVGVGLHVNRLPPSDSKRHSQIKDNCGADNN